MLQGANINRGTNDTLAAHLQPDSPAQIMVLRPISSSLSTHLCEELVDLRFMTIV
jgi:hypothetical protein